LLPQIFEVEIKSNSAFARADCKGGVLQMRSINFIDSKGLLHFTQHDPKIQFYQKNKELEAG